MHFEEVILLVDTLKLTLIGNIVAVAGTNIFISNNAKHLLGFNTIKPIVTIP